MSKATERESSVVIVDSNEVNKKHPQSNPTPSVNGNKTAKSVMKKGLVLPRWQPFPVDVLPEPVCSYVFDGAIALGCDTSFVALPLLAALASAIGNKRRIELKGSWTEPSILWTAIVGDSGTTKSPALELPLRAIRQRQHLAMKKFTAEMEVFQRNFERYERDFTSWKRNNDGSDPPEKPQEPFCPRCWCDDSTVEALAVLLVQNWPGIIMVRDELSGWLRNFDRYAQGKGGDVAKWLEFFGGRQCIVDRKCGIPRTTYIPRAAVSVCGGIQPQILRRSLGMEYRENGLAARLLFAYPPKRSKRWNEAEISPDAEAKIAGIFDKLYGLEPVYDENGDPQPLKLPLTPEGKKVWIQFYNEHAQEQTDLTGDLSAAWSKLEGYAARLALIIHCVRQAAGDPTLITPGAIDEGSIIAGVTLSRWFGNEAKRVYATFEESEEEQEQRQLVEWIAQRGGRITVRDLMHGKRRYRESAELPWDDLNELFKAGRGHWIYLPSGDSGGRPSEVFELFPEFSGSNTLEISTYNEELLPLPHNPEDKQQSSTTDLSPVNDAKMETGVVEEMAKWEG